MFIREFDEKNITQVFEEFYKGSLANDMQIVSFFEARIKQLDNQIHDVSKSLGNVIYTINDQALDTQDLEESLLSLGLEVNNILRTIQVLANVTQGVLINKGELERANTVLRNDYEDNITNLDRKSDELNKEIQKIDDKLKKLFSNILRTIEHKISQEDESLLQRRFLPLLNIVRKDINNVEKKLSSSFSNILDDLGTKIEQEDTVVLEKQFFPLIKIIRADIADTEEKLKASFSGVLNILEKKLGQEGKISLKKRFAPLLEISYEEVAKIEEKFNASFSNILNILEEKINQEDEVFLEKRFKPLLKISSEQIANVEKKIDELPSDILNILEGQIANEEDTLLRKQFFPLIEIIRKYIIEEELKNRQVFNDLFREPFEKAFKDSLKAATEQYSKVNERVTSLNDVIEKMTVQKEEVLSKDILVEQINSVRKEIEQDNYALYGKITQELNSVAEQNFSSIEELQEQYQKIISIFNGEVDAIDREGTVEAFRPLITELIDTELGERGRFVELLSQSIDKLSKETDEHIQKTFKQIVTTIVGEGSKQNQNMARQNTEIGLRKMSESEIDDLLGRKLTNIVDKRSNFGDALNTLADNLNKVRVFSAANSQQQVAQKFFDGLSFSIYYYKFSIDENIKIADETLLPDKIKVEGELDYIAEFEKTIAKFEDDIGNKQSEKYKRYKKVQTKQFTDSTTMQTLDVYCYFRYFDGQKAYFFLNQEPSIFFKKELDNILSLNLDIKEAAKRVKGLVKNYSIPKVQLAVFNKEAFDLPSEDDDSSVVSNKSGDKGLELEEEGELSKVLDRIEDYHADKKIKKTIFSYFSKNYQYSEYIGSDNLWYFWSIKTPAEKYLSVKMVKSFDDDESEKEFITHVTNNVWHGLQKSKNTGEMQDLVDSFTQKDTNVFSVDSWLIELFKFVTKNWLSLFIIVLSSIVSFWLWSSQQSLQQNVKNELFPKVETTKSELTKDIAKKDKRIQELEQELDNSQKNLLLNLRNTFRLNAKVFEFDKPFIFEKFKYDINALVDQGDVKGRNRLKHIRENIHPIIREGGTVELSLVPHINKQEDHQQFNSDRAEAIEEYLYHGLNENEKSKLSINIEEDKDKLIPEKAFGVSIEFKTPYIESNREN